MKNKKKNILFVTSSLISNRNYLRKNILESVLAKYNIYVLHSKNNIINTNKLNFDNISKYSYSSINEKIHFFILDCLTWRYRKKSISFRFRIKRFTQIDYNFYKNENFILKIIKICWRIIISNLTYIRYLFGSKYIFNLIIIIFDKLIKINKDLEKTILEHKVSLIIHPSSAYSPIANDIARISKKNNIPSLFIIDNWDNMSSKSILYFKPTAIAVWGQQSKEHAISIQNINPEKIHLIGTARFDHYYKLVNKNIKSHFKFKYILFLGTAIQFDEEIALSKLVDLITNSSKFKNYKILYRPHPWRQSNNIINIKSDKIIIDPQIKRAYFNLDKNFQPDLDYYPSLIKNAELIVGGLTSMLIESMIFKKKYIALIFDDNKNITNQKNAFKNYLHFEGIEKIETLILCQDLKLLNKIIETNIKTKKIIDMKKYEDILNYYIYNDKYSYSQRLIKIVNKYIEK